MSSSPSPLAERAPSKGVRFQSATPADPVEWPFEHFPSPPPDGRWIPKFGPRPPSKFPPPLPDVPARLSLDPPIVPFTYPPESPLYVDDPSWLNKMLADLCRQRSHLETCLDVAQSEVANAYAEAGLADSELEDERSNMQAFLNMVASVAGSGFVRRMLQDVEHSVEVMSKPPADGSAYDSSSSSPSGGSANSAHEPAM